MKIPKKIFYCWFGKKQKSREILEFIETWKEFMPEYEIIEINESNFAIVDYPYAKSAYEAGKFAFVSDCARIAFLQKTGGFYFDTDVEMKKTLASLIADSDAKIILSMEYFNYELTGVNTAVIISEPNCQLWSELLAFYQTHELETHDEPQTINMHINKLLTENTKFSYKDKNQELMYKTDKIDILRAKYLMRNQKTAYTIHHLSGTWKKELSFSRRVRRMAGIILKKVIGRSNFERLWNKHDK